jgi:hypothetical protein
MRKFHENKQQTIHPTLRPTVANPHSSEMLASSYLLAAVAATLAAGQPLNLTKRTDGTAHVKFYSDTGCQTEAGTYGAQKYGKSYLAPETGFKSIKYTGVHSGDAVKHIQLCATMYEKNGEFCKTGKPGSPFCFTPDADTYIVSEKVIGIKN